MVGLRVTRRCLLALALSAPAVGWTWEASATDSAMRRVGEALIVEHSLPTARALLAANAARLHELDAAALNEASAADFRARRTLTVGGVLLSEVEAAWCLRHALEGGAQ